MYSYNVLIFYKYAAIAALIPLDFLCLYIVLLKTDKPYEHLCGNSIIEKPKGFKPQ